MNDPSHAATMRACRATLAANSKTFAAAGRLLPGDALDRAASLYAWCRRVDDAIDDCPVAEQPRALDALTRELDAVYENSGAFDEPALRAFQAVVQTTQLPRLYPDELLEGMAMDVRDERYHSLDALLRYCHRVAGVVGLMMCHVFGITRDSALTPAAQLGVAMQLTNICRDVAEDFALGRVYLPRDMLLAAGAPPLPDALHGALPDDPALVHAMSHVMQRLLAEADRYYASAEQGFTALPFRAGLAARAAMHLYRAIGAVIASRQFDPTRGRAVVSPARKLVLIAWALARHLASLPRFVAERLHNAPRLPRTVLRFPDEVLPPRDP